jgi:hypothetical protein
MEWASRQAAVLGDVEIDIRPVTEGVGYRHDSRAGEGHNAESKELIAGYVIVSAESLEDAARLATR